MQWISSFWFVFVMWWNFNATLAKRMWVACCVNFCLLKKCKAMHCGPLGIPALGGCGWEQKNGKFKIIFQLHSKVEASLGYMRPYLKKNTVGIASCKGIVSTLQAEVWVPYQFRLDSETIPQRTEKEIVNKIKWKLNLRTLSLHIE